MSSIDDWRLAGELSVLDATLLMLGNNPTDCDEYEKVLYDRIDRYKAISTALKNAITMGSLKAKVYEGQYEGEIISHLTIIRVSDLKAFLKERDYHDEFFWPQEQVSQNLLDSSHPYYSLKLAAAVRAVQAMIADPGLLIGKTPRQACLDWLRGNAIELGLANSRGQPLKKATEDLSRICNWNMKGGAPRTRATKTSAAMSVVK